MQTTLRVVSGAIVATVPAGQPFVVGRARSADFVMPDSRVSRRHLLIEPVGAGWAVRDISSNGTWLDGQRVQSVDVNGEIRFRLGTPTGPEVVVLPEVPAAGEAPSEYEDPHFEMPTMLRSAARVEPGPHLPRQAPRRPDDAGGPDL
uniref:FHA domain-containing protein n=1 Tax=Frankia sp. Cas3 TaxID=3073926 RepID=UPI002AD4A6E1